MPPVGYEPTIPAGERLQTYALDRAATETSRSMNDSKLMIVLSVVCLAVCVCVCARWCRVCLQETCPGVRYLLTRTSILTV